MVTQVIKKSESDWTEQPHRALGRPAVRARSDGAMAVVGAGSFSWRADLPQSLGGSNQAPSPTALLLSALAGCAVVFIKDTLAPQLGVQIDSVRATASCSTDARGLLGMDGSSPELGDVCLEVTIESPAGQPEVDRVVDAWRERCPAFLALTQPTPVRVVTRAIDPYAVN
jgi:uncharacterized OsmC-like protein